MRVTGLPVLLLVLFVAACGDSNQPTKVWETAGFENPESALPDTAAGVIYVSNVAGGPAVKDGNGYISKLTLDGKITTAKWVTGLDAPKGLALVGERLFVADVDQLVEIDVAAGSIAARHQAPGAKILNDIAVDGSGNIYVSDWGGTAIWRLSGGTFEKWLESDELANPNGLLVEGDKLIVALWGAMKPDFSTDVPGHLVSVKLADKSIEPIGEGQPIGNLDGLEPFDAESYIVTDWIAGKVFKIASTGAFEEILKLSQGSANLGYIAATRTAIIPMMMDGKVVAYKF